MCRVPGPHPAMFAERSGVVVGVERHPHGETAPDLLAHVGVSPARLGRVRDVAPRRRRELLVDRTERTDSDRLDGPFALEEGDGTFDRLFGVVVAIVSVARRSSGPFPTAHSHFDPPVSIPTVSTHFAPHDLRMMNSPGRTTSCRRSGPRPSMRSRSSCVPSVPNVCAGCSIAVRNG